MNAPTHRSRARSAACILAIDGGGTHTRVRLATAAGATLCDRQFRGSAKPFVVGVEEGARRLATWCIRTLAAAHVPARRVAAVAAGMAGVGDDRDRARFARALHGALRRTGIDVRRVRLETDAAIALLGAFPTGPGIVLIGGTGAIAVGRTPRGAIARVGGWGRTVGDEGSGAWIGTRGLRAITHAVDGRAPHGALVRAFSRAYPALRRLEPRALRSAIAAGRVHVEDVAPLVLRAAAAGDRAARAIVREAAAQLADQIAAMVRRAFRNAPRVALTLHGGVVHQPQVRSRLVRILRERSPAVRIVAGAGSPLDGAVRLAIGRHVHFDI